ncbi:MAG: sel1 repeat family protein [Acidobacteriota bacterium]|nr:sel1 repeat family protein [Acidobacteriota bacterium]
MDPDAPHPAADFNRALRCAAPAESFPHLLRAAENGCLRAQFLVGLAYHTGRGVPTDFSRARAWYARAAGSGDGNAITNLGVMTLLGQGSPADDIEAYTWLQSAVGLGHTWLRPALEMLEHRIQGRPDAAPPISLAPESPVFGPCSQPGCDPSRCNVG